MGPRGRSNRIRLVAERSDPHLPPAKTKRVFAALRRVKGELVINSDGDVCAREDVEQTQGAHVVFDSGEVDK